MSDVEPVPPREREAIEAAKAAQDDPEEDEFAAERRARHIGDMEALRRQHDMEGGE